MTEFRELTPSARFRRHGHESVHVVAVLEGGFGEWGSRTCEDLGTGGVRLSPPMNHRIDFGPDGARCLVIECAGGLTVSGQSTFLRGDPLLASLAASLARALRSTGAERLLWIEGCETEFLAQVERRRAGRCTPPPEWLVRVRDRIHDDPPTARVGRLACEVGIHRVHLARVFRDHMGASVSAYARRERVRLALQLIERHEFPLSVVAAAAGFADQAHMTRVVRSTAGTTPGALRALPRFKTEADRRS